jgi:hypothetical protein
MKVRPHVGASLAAGFANDPRLEMDAAELRLRAERRLGIMLAEQKPTIGMNKGTLRRGTDEEPRDQRPTLAEVGIDKKPSARSRKVGGIGEQAFEAMIENVRRRIADGGRVALDVTAMGL